MSETSRGPPYAGSPLAFLIGLLLFLGSILLFVVDLLLGNAVMRSIVMNALGAAVMILWAAQDTLFDPDSTVTSIGGASGTALLLYGVYLLFAGIVIAGTGVFLHDRVRLGTIYIGLAVVATVVGLLIFPTSAFVAAEEAQTVEEEPGEQGSAEEEPADEESVAEESGEEKSADEESVAVESGEEKFAAGESEDSDSSGE